MNQLQIVTEGASDEANTFGIQLEQPMSSNVGKSLYHKPYGMVIDAAKQDARVLEG
ncbi:MULTISPECIES: hypothetical protein [Dyella]|uniref:Uncharacterized protein n=1 Tax=Dyella lutea TaxID=2950441 RepID=A0ABT1F8C9_9GAMM|nr:MULTISPECIES: hypothetical protein [Dyella]MCP1373624.1 hypothetical protein [Dyella lutea]